LEFIITDAMILWNDEGRDKYTQAFSVFRYGFQTAKELAIKFRARKERELPHYANALQNNVAQRMVNEFDDDDQ